MNHPTPADVYLGIIIAGLLTYPVYCAFPVKTSGKSTINNILQRGGNTATGIVPDSHRIPFSSSI